MNFLTAKVGEEDGKVILQEESFKVAATADQAQYLKPYVGKEIYFGIRPENLEFQPTPAAENDMTLKVTTVEPLGATTTLWMNTTENQPLVANTGPDYTFTVDDTVHFAPNMEKARYFDKETELAIMPAE
jgi:multiple sugar transport system ATP-binding protein